MNKSIPFEVLGPNQFIMFDIQRLAELEKAMGQTITSIANRQDVGVNFCLTALPIGMKQHYRPNTEFYAQRIQEHLDNGGTIDDFAVPLVKAIAASGIFGKEAQDKVEQELRKLSGVEPDQDEVAPKNVKKRTEK
jgi:hypothetical protein